MKKRPFDPYTYGLLIWGTLLFVLLCTSCGHDAAGGTRTYNRMDGKCEVTKLEWDTSDAAGTCFCKVRGKSEHNEDVIVYIGIDKRHCR